MNSTSEVSKLEELRAKTDRDLLVLIARQVERGLLLLHLAASPGSATYREAVAACAEAEMLLPRLDAVERQARQRLECKVRQLRRELESAAAQPTSWIPADRPP